MDDQQARAVADMAVTNANLAAENAEMRQQMEEMTRLLAEAHERAQSLVSERGPNPPRRTFREFYRERTGRDLYDDDEAMRSHGVSFLRYQVERIAAEYRFDILECDG